MTNQPRIYYITRACTTRGVRAVMAQPPTRKDGYIYPFGFGRRSYRIGRTAFETWPEARTAALEQLAKRESTLKNEMQRLRRISFTRPTEMMVDDE